MKLLCVAIIASMHNSNTPVVKSYKDGIDDPNGIGRVCTAEGLTAEFGSVPDSINITFVGEDEVACVQLSPNYIGPIFNDFAASISAAGIDDASCLAVAHSVADAYAEAYVIWNLKGAVKTSILNYFPRGAAANCSEESLMKLFDTFNEVSLSILDDFIDEIKHADDL